MTLYFQTADGRVVLHHGDVLVVLRGLPSESVDAIVTDPPYNCGKDFGNGREADQKDNYLEWLWEVWVECGRVARPGSFLVYTNRWRHLQFAFTPPEPWHFFHVAIWHKPLSLAGTFYGILPHWEPIIMWTKGKPWRPFRGPDVMSDVLSENVVAGPKRHDMRIHPTVKPVELIRKLVRFACPQGGLVLDPFLGTGTTALAAVYMGRRCIGIDLNAEYLQLSVERLRQQVLL